MSLTSITSVEQLPVMEAFYSIQGEGYFQGQAAYFIRLAGCEVGCVWCDVKESWSADVYPRLAVEKIVSDAKLFASKKVIITGGEPLMYDLTTLTKALHREGFRNHLETSGAYPPLGSLDWICLSPKKFKPPLEMFYALAHELKVIIYHRSDLLWAEKYARSMHRKCHLFLQPEWNRQAEMMPLIIDHVKQHPHWKISLQTHKFMDIP